MTYVRGRGGGRGMGERVRKILYHIYRERERERGGRSMVTYECLQYNDNHFYMI